MLELKALTDVSILEVVLGIAFSLISIAVTAYLHKMKGRCYLFYGFALLALWNIIEVIDEFFVKNEIREIIFNIFGRIILIIALIYMIFGLRKFLRLEKKAKTGKQKKKGTIIFALAALAALVLILFLNQNTNFLTSLAIAEDNVGVNVDLYPLSREINPGDDIRVSTRIDTNEDEKLDATIIYTITDNKGVQVFQKSRTLAVERTAAVTDTLNIHRTLDPGPYLVDVEVSYKDKRKSEKDTFNVVAQPAEIKFGNREAILLLVILIMLIIFFVLLWVQNRRVSKIIKEHEKYDIGHIMK